MPDLIQEVAWPGVLAIESMVCSFSHGISPSLITIVTIPQPGDAPAEFGDLVFGDGVRTIRLRDCKASSITPRVGGDGTSWTLEILDRRWRWMFGNISGRYNQLDPRGKLIPWTIRSPEELAILCLEAMGETSYLIDLPDGLEKADGANLDDYLRVGQNFRQSLANPPVVWDHTPPAAALSRLVEQFGRRVVFQPIRNRVVIAKLGEGEPLPEGPCEVIGATIDAPETPSAVAVAGAPIRFQFRLLLDAVGEEWDTSVRQCNSLTYTPPGDIAGQPQIVTLGHRGPVPVGAEPHPGIKITLTRTLESGLLAVRTYQNTDTNVSVENKLIAIAAEINASGEYTATTSGSDITISRTDFEPFEVDWIDPLLNSPILGTITLVQAPRVVGPTWRYTVPPSFPYVIATDRLSYDEAKALAQKGVYRWYRIRPPDEVPGYSGDILRRQQLILQSTKAAQVVPIPRKPGGSDKGNTIGEAGKAGVIPEFYNGYSRDQQATVSGSIAWHLGTVIWDDPPSNTANTQRVYVPFSIDPVEQVVMFADYVYRNEVIGPDYCFVFADLLLETACLVQDAETNSYVRYEKILPLGGRGPVEWQVVEDIQIGIVALYQDPDRPRKVTKIVTVDKEDADARADYYLAGMAAKYKLVGGETRQYIGIVAIDLDGYRQQVSWSIGGGGATTTASGNCEHSDVVPPYPARRRAENLPPDSAARWANLIEYRKVLGDAGEKGLGALQARALSDARRGANR